MKGILVAVCALWGFLLLMALAGALLAGCSTIDLKSGNFEASRTAWFMDTQANMDLKTPDGASVSVSGLQSTVNTKTLETLVGLAGMAKP
jgi:hypothetical protein